MSDAILGPQWRQKGFGALSGELVASKCIDLQDSPGKLKLARPLKLAATASTIGDKEIQAFAYFGQSAYAVTDTVLYSADSPFTSWSSADTTPTDAQDMVVFNGYLVITTNTNIDYWSSALSYVENWWTARGNPALTTSSITSLPHVLEVIRIGSETLAVTDGPMVHAYTGEVNTGSGTSVTVDLDDSMTACCIKSAIRKVWIGTFTEDADQAYVYEWDGASTNYTQAFPVGAKAVLAMTLIDNVPLIVTERGEIKLFNGAGFTTVARFPFATRAKFAENVETGQVQNNNVSRPIHPKGMHRVGNQVYIAAAWSTDGADTPIDENTPYGIWSLDLTTYSLTHLASPGGVSFSGRSMPLMVINSPHARLFCGGKLPTTADEEGIWIEDFGSTANYGYFVTVEIPTENILDVWDKVIVKALLNSSSSVVVKYRTERNTALPVIADMTWATTTQFNTTTDLSDVSVGDEVEIIHGTSAGRLAHVTAIETSASTYAVTIDTALGTFGEASNVRFDNWKKIDKPYTSGKLQQYGPNAVSDRIQFKVALEGSEGYPEINQFMAHSNPKQSL